MWNELTTIAERIKAEHHAAVVAAGTAIEHAIACGQLLIEAKAQVQHGEWLPWLEANCELSARQAQKYMRLASEGPDLLAANTPSKADLTIDEALAVIATPKRPSPATPLTADEHVVSLLGMYEQVGSLEQRKRLEEIQTSPRTSRGTLINPHSERRLSPPKPEVLERLVTELEYIVDVFNQCQLCEHHEALARFKIAIHALINIKVRWRRANGHTTLET